MTKEATDLVARLRDMDSGLSHAVWDRGCQSCALNSNTLNEAATLIEAQAAEIEGLKRERDEACELMTAAIKRGAPAYGEPGSF